MNDDCLSRPSAALHVLRQVARNNKKEKDGVLPLKM